MSKYQTSTKTRQALIEAAGQLAAEKGFNTISTRTIAHLSGENIGSIHYHFGGKLKLFEAVIRSVASRWQENPLEAALADCDMATAVGQAEAIRRIVNRVVELLFDKELPSWHCRVIFQVMQHPNPLQDVFTSIVINPENKQVCKLLKSIDPAMNDEMAELHSLVLLTPLFLHAGHQNSLLRKMEKTEYSHQYFQHLANICITQTLLFFNLPVVTDVSAQTCPSN